MSGIHPGARLRRPPLVIALGNHRVKSQDSRHTDLEPKDPAARRVPER